MPKRKLTEKFIENLQPAPVGTRVEFFDATLPAFGLRVTDKGSKTWFCMFRVDGRLRRHTLGPYLARRCA